VTRRLVATYLTITAFVLVVLILPLGRTFADREEDRLLSDIERDARVVAALVEDSLEAGTTPQLSALLAGYAEDPGGRIVIVDTVGVSVADSDDPEGPRRDFSTRPEFVTALDGQGNVGRRFSETLGGDLLFVAVPVRSGAGILGAVRVTFPGTALDDAIRDNWLRLGLLSGVVLLSVTAVGLMLARGVTRPVRELESAAEDIAAGDLHRRVEVGGAPELRGLGATFNTMAGRVESLVDAQSSFAADASHQLRTPLTALRLRLENLEATVGDDQQDAVAAALAETNRLSRLVDGLLTLARVEAAAVPTERIDLAEAVRSRYEVWGPLVAESELRMRLDAPAAAPARAVPGAVEQILDNLISNAMDASPPGGTITIAVRPRDGAWEVHVVDEGPGMPAEERERAFDRFRTGGKPGKGSGLGLTIVRRLAAASDGAVELREAGSGGVDAVVDLPAVRA
jgi:signal transduction histidine kinase